MSQFLGNNENTLGQCKFHVNSDIEEADAWFVIEDADDDDRTCVIPRGNLFFLTAETAWPIGYYSDSPSRMAFIQQFSQQFTCHDLYEDSSTYSMPFLPWMINANHGVSMFAPHERDACYLQELTSLPKDRKLSVFCSAQTLTASHRLRLRFVEQLKAHFGDELDWFGNGVSPLPEKWDGIAPYKYTIVLENHSSNNVITEKIQDAFLGLSYPIYWGAPNINDYFAPNSMTTIDIKDLRGSIRVIEQVLNDDPYDSALEALLVSKSKVVQELLFLKRIADIAISVNPEVSESHKVSVGLQPFSDFDTSSRRRVGEGVQKAGKIVQRLGTKLNF